MGCEQSTPVVTTTSNPFQHPFGKWFNQNMVSSMILELLPNGRYNFQMRNIAGMMIQTCGVYGERYLFILRRRTTCNVLLILAPFHFFFTLLSLSGQRILYARVPFLNNEWLGCNRVYRKPNRVFQPTVWLCWIRTPAVLQSESERKSRFGRRLFLRSSTIELIQQRRGIPGAGRDQ